MRGTNSERNVINSRMKEIDGEFQVGDARPPRRVCGVDADCRLSGHGQANTGDLVVADAANALTRAFVDWSTRRDGRGESNPAGSADTSGRAIAFLQLCDP